MNWTHFLLGFCAGAILFDLLWRFTFRLHTTLTKEQAEYIKELHGHLGLEP